MTRERKSFTTSTPGDAVPRVQRHGRLFPDDVAETEPGLRRLLLPEAAEGLRCEGGGEAPARGPQQERRNDD